MSFIRKIIIALVLISSSLVMVPVASHAMMASTVDSPLTSTPTVDQLKAQILALQAQLAALLALVSNLNSNTNQPCTITASKTVVSPGETFTLKWTTSGITDPVMYQNVPAGGYVAVASNGSMSWTAETLKGGEFNDAFSIGTGGKGLTPFTSKCTVSVKVSPGGIAATIDKNSLTASTGEKSAAIAVLTGTATNVSEVQVSLDGVDGGIHNQHANVVNGHWSVTMASVTPGNHSVLVQDADSNSYYTYALATGTLVVTNGSTPVSRPVCGLFRGGTDQAKNMIASPNPASSVADNDSACLSYCNASGYKNGDMCIRGTFVIKNYGDGMPVITAFTASATTVALGQPVTFSWTTTGTARCWLYGPTSKSPNVPDSVALNGSVTVTPTQTASDFHQGKVSTYALSCESNTQQQPGGNFNQTGKQIILTLTASAPTAVYRAYLNGSATANVVTNNSTEADALANCKLNSKNNPTSSIRCTWGDKEIYSYNPSNSTRPVCGLFRGGTDQAKNMIASPNPASSVADTDAACISYCDVSGTKSGDICMRGSSTIKTYGNTSSGGPAATLAALQAALDALKTSLGY